MLTFPGLAIGLSIDLHSYMRHVTNILAQSSSVISWDVYMIILVVDVLHQLPVFDSVVEISPNACFCDGMLHQ